MLPASLLALGPARAERLRLADGTPVRLWLRAELSSVRAHLSDRVDFEVADPVVVQGRIVVPVGSVAWGAVQSVKEKEVKFDIEGVRLPNLQIVKLRSVREKTKRAGKDQIKVEDRVSDGVGAPAGAAFTAYLDEDAEVDVPGAGEVKPAAAPAVATPPVPAKETAVLPNPSPESPRTPAAPPRPAITGSSSSATVINLFPSR